MPRGHDRRQHLQLGLDVGAPPMGEAQPAGTEGTEALPAAKGPARLAGTDRLREDVGARENLKKARRQVQAHTGSPGRDGMPVAPLPGYLKQHGPAIREQRLPGP